MMSNNEVIERYKAAYKNLYGKEVEVRHAGGGWYFIDYEKHSSKSRWKINSILAMAKRLEERAVTSA